MRNVILLMLFCGSANAGMHSCVDDRGNKVLRSEPCEQNEKQQPIVIKVDPSYYVINSTGEKQGIDSYHAKQAQKSSPSIAAGDNKAKQHPLPEQMQKILSDAKAFGLEHPNNGGLIIASAYCGLWKNNVQAEPRQALLADAEAFAFEHPNNGALYVSAALGRCPDAASPPAPPHIITAPQPMIAPQPSVITNCDGAGCWDDVGGRYDKGAGNTYFGPNGACQNIGGMMQCP